jgi:DNA-directed RNA polymerase subunit RPC12/RpoP
MQDKLQISRREESGTTFISLQGILNGDANLSNLFKDVKGRVVVSLKYMSRLDPSGISAWIEALAGMPEDADLELEDCPPQVVRKMNVIANLAPPGTVKSFLMPYFCIKCSKEFSVRLSVGVFVKQGVKVPEIKCPRCKNQLEFASIPGRYLFFLENKETSRK